jgi:hypothetical protein
VDNRVSNERRRRRTTYFTVFAVIGVVVVFASLGWSTFAVGQFGRGPSVGRARVDEFALVLVSMVAMFGIARLLIGDAQATRAEKVRVRR